MSRLRDMHVHAEGIVFSWKASEERFYNLRAEMWFKMAEWLKGGAALPSDAVLQAELCAPTYSNDNASNRLQIEQKGDIKARLGFSPDMADALALTFARPVFQVDHELAVLGAYSNHAKTEWDPYAEGRT